MSEPASPVPRKFDTNLVVIGAGSAGLVTAYVAAAAKAKVTLIEREKMGGDCLNTGCVPSKAIIRSAKVAAYIQRANEFGLAAGPLRVDFPQVMRRVHDVIAKVEPHDSVERYTSLGVDCVSGSARITSPWTVEVDGRTLTTRSIVIATGGRPFVPPVPGLADTGYVTSDTIWQLKALPRRLLVIGGGPIGCELAQAFARLGSEVTQVEKGPRLLSREDPAVAETLTARFSAEGIRVLTGYAAERFEQQDGEKIAVCAGADGEQRVSFDEVLVAVGRRANTDGLEIGNAGLELNQNGTIPVNEYLQTSQPHILACGDVTGPYQLTHAAGFQGWFCAMNALFGSIKRFKVDYSVMPWAVFTDPEIGPRGNDGRRRRSAGHSVRDHRVRYRRPGPCHRRQRGPRFRENRDEEGQRPDPRRHGGRPPRRGAGHRVRHCDEVRHGPAQDPEHHSHLPHAGRGQSLCRRQLAEGTHLTPGAQDRGTFPPLAPRLTGDFPSSECPQAPQNLSVGAASAATKPQMDARVLSRHSRG